MENLTWSEVYKPVHDFIYTKTELAVWIIFGFLLFVLFVLIVSSVELRRFLVTLFVFAAVVAAGLYYLGYLHQIIPAHGI